MLKKDLPLIKLTINPDDNSFVSAISIVKDPAVESSFIAFSNNQQIDFAANDERMELIGIAMRSDVPIYRNSPQLGEYACVFDADTVRKIAQEYFKQGFANNMNIEHSDKSAGSYVFQSYICDSTKNMPSPKGIDAKDNDWIIGVKVESPEIWKEIKDGKTTGFSIEGMFQFIDTHTTVNLSQQNILSELEQALIELEELEKLKDNISKS